MIKTLFPMANYSSLVFHLLNTFQINPNYKSRNQSRALHQCYNLMTHTHTQKPLNKLAFKSNYETVSCVCINIAIFFILKTL